VAVAIAIAMAAMAIAILVAMTATMAITVAITVAIPVTMAITVSVAMAIAMVVVVTAIIIVIVVIVVTAVVVIVIIAVVIIATVITAIIIVVVVVVVVTAVVVIVIIAVVIIATAVAAIVIVVVVIVVIAAAIVAAAVVTAAIVAAAVVTAAVVPIAVIAAAALVRNVRIGTGATARRRGRCSIARRSPDKAGRGRIVAAAGGGSLEPAPAKAVGELQQSLATGRIGHRSTRHPDSVGNVETCEEGRLRTPGNLGQGHACGDQVSISLRACGKSVYGRLDCRNAALKHAGRTALQNSFYQCASLLAKRSRGQADSRKGRTEKQCKGQFSHGILHNATSQREITNDEVQAIELHWITRTDMLPC
jgi:hypothetical protein